jgi:HTH-type transcriptional regulator/antitoxin HipB
MGSSLRIVRAIQRFSTTTRDRGWRGPLERPKRPERDEMYFFAEIIPYGSIVIFVPVFFPSGSGAVKLQTIRSAGEFGRAIRLRRKALGLTQGGVAQVAGVGNRFVSEVERGKPTAEFGKVLRLVSVLGLDVQIACRPGAMP